MKKIVIEDRKVIVGTGEELTPVVKSMWEFQLLKFQQFRRQISPPFFLIKEGGD